MGIDKLVYGHNGGGAFSVGPYHKVRKPYEQLSLFFNLNMVAGTVPDGLFGQMLLMDKRVIDASGGTPASAAGFSRTSGSPRNVALRESRRAACLGAGCSRSACTPMARGS